MQLAGKGNSRLLRIPKPLIERCGFGTYVDVRAVGRSVVISRNSPRRGWEQTFAQSTKLDARVTPEQFESEEWNW